MIAGLELDRDTEERLRTTFSGWAPQFREALAQGGIPWLLATFQTLVESIETRSCSHGKGGRLLTGVDWQDCCGISYEYRNDISVRDAIDEVLRVAPSATIQQWSAQLAALDDRLYGLYERRPLRVGRWWHDGLPRGVVD